MTFTNHEEEATKLWTADSFAACLLGQSRGPLTQTQAVPTEKIKKQGLHKIPSSPTFWHVQVLNPFDTCDISKSMTSGSVFEVEKYTL